MSLLMLRQIFGVFLNTLTAEAKYLVQDGENLQLATQMQLSQNKKPFLNFLFHFWNLDQILTTLKKRMIVTANVYPKLQTLKILVRPLSISEITDCEKPV